MQNTQPRQPASRPLESDTGVSSKPWLLELRVRGSLERLVVLELGERELVARLDPQSSTPALPWNVEHGQLRRADQPGVVDLPSVYLRLLATELHGEKIVSVVPQDSATRAALWQAARADLRPRVREPVLDAVRPGRIPARGQHTEAARLERLSWLRQHGQGSLEALSATRLNPERLCFNVENLIGAVEIPVGIAGPLLIDGDFARGTFCAPLATTEGALVASATRGARALSAAGGVRVRVLHQRMTRAPLFVFDDVSAAVTFACWAEDHLDELRAESRRVSTHATLLELQPLIIGDTVHLVFSYETGDAAGQNMTTACTWRACNWMLSEVSHLRGVRVRAFFIDGALSGDKRLNVKSLSSGRGIRVVAESALSEDICREMLGVSADWLQRAYPKSLLAALQGGSVGYTVNAPNVVAALFAATGQDLACVHESGVGLFSLELAAGQLRASITLTNLVIGTVGGGTHLPAQSALLDSMGCLGTGGVFRLAEITAAFCLALELSTMAALAAGTFVDAHERLGRNRPRGLFTRADLTPQLLEGPLRLRLGEPALSVQAVEVSPLSAEHGNMHALHGARPGRLLGLHSARVTAAVGASGELLERDYVVKLKPRDVEVLEMLDASAAAWGGRIEAAWAGVRDSTQFVGAHERELAIYQQTDARFTAHVPPVLLTLRDPERDAYLLMLERIGSSDALLDAIDDTDEWRPTDIGAALDGIAQVHAIWFDRERELRETPWLGPVPSTANSLLMAELCRAIEAPASAVMPGRVPQSAWTMRRELCDSVAEWWPRLEAQPRTLVHNDFQPRNVAIVARARHPRLCAYDWELATSLPPQHDLAELLTFTLPPEVSASTVEHYVEHHRARLSAALGRELEPAAWREGYALCLRDLLLNRFTFYILADCLRPRPFFVRSLHTLCRLLELAG